MVPRRQNQLQESYITLNIQRAMKCLAHSRTIATCSQAYKVRLWFPLEREREMEKNLVLKNSLGMMHRYID